MGSGATATATAPDVLLGPSRPLYRRVLRQGSSGFNQARGAAVRSPGTCGWVTRRNGGLLSCRAAVLRGLWDEQKTAWSGNDVVGISEEKRRLRNATRTEDSVFRWGEAGPAPGVAGMRRRGSVVGSGCEGANGPGEEEAVALTVCDGLVGTRGRPALMSELSWHAPT